MFNKTIDYDALWDEIENELDTDVAIDEYQDPNNIYPSQFYPGYQPVGYDPRFFMFFPHRRRFFL
ncbi:hypothetical protein MK805_11130 [Shimazuella sp. AN120528]|uniref:hypothetical protein n=1 Tax=Shimazuella soli TaxID=1892854 RepID=UPI001F1097AC|nr:hypothetical protein [Shimazuella soli]MCH5585505.1 hypothetical protein [Shimazuella soli]